MDSMPTTPTTPGMPLFAMTPERVNVQRGMLENARPSSTSPTKHFRTNSEVQSMVARFNSLDIKDHQELRKKDEAALRRAQMGREEAESELKAVKEEARALRKDVSEGKERERRVMKRLDVVMEDLHRAKETQAHAQTLYEKEIRKARKEAFRSSSALVKLQEELKSARNSLRVHQSNLELEKIKVSRREQDAFNAQYQLVGAQEELSIAAARILVVEEERDALKTNLKEEEVARIAAEGRIALPLPQAGEDDEIASPKKRQTPLQAKHPEAHRSHEQHPFNTDIERERRLRRMAEEQIEFMKMECQFQCCSCRVAEQQGETYVYDVNYAEHSKRPAPSGQLAKSTILPVNAVKDILMDMEVDDVEANVVAEQPPTRNDPEEVQDHREADPAEEALRSPSSSAPTFDAEQERQAHKAFIEEHEPREHPSEHTSCAQNTQRASFSLHTETSSNTLQMSVTEANVDIEPTVQPNVPATPISKSIWNATRTITVPLADNKPSDYSDVFSPANITREEAIERIRQRRGRARSVAGTPKKGGLDPLTPRRDISAPEVRMAKTPKTAPQGRKLNR